MTTKTFYIVKRGRKYFDCLLVGKRDYKAKLIINDVSKDFAVDSTVAILVRDVSTHSGFGSSMTFEPTTADAEAKLQDATDRFYEQKKWLEYAESDATQGQVTSNAIRRTIAECTDPRLADRLAQLKAAVAKNSTPAQAPQRATAPASAASQAAPVRQILFPVSEAPRLNAPVRFGGGVVVFTDMGSRQRIGDDDPSVHGNQLIAHEGEWGVFCRFRLATAEEIASLETVAH